jgi:AGZA family xanthine/uracil permease-like MFS transporter
LDLSGLISGALIPVVLAFLFVDIFDTAGSLLGVGRLAGFVDGSGRLPGSDRAFMADASGTVAGSLLGTSTVTTYIESAAGVQEGGRTGLTAVVTALCFLAALFLTPLFVAVPAVATAPALIVVGSMMMVGAVDVDWRKLQEGLPAFLTIVGMPFTYSIANGICFGILSYVAIKVIAGKFREISPVLWVLAILLAAWYAFGGAA